jgi:hypothetical protein
MMTNKHESISETINAIYELAKKSESFRSVLGMMAWVITFIVATVMGKEIVYGILFSTTALIVVMLGTMGDDDDDD